MKRDGQVMFLQNCDFDKDFLYLFKASQIFFLTSFVDLDRLCSDPDPGLHVLSVPDSAPEPNRIRIRPK